MTPTVYACGKVNFILQGKLPGNYVSGAAAGNEYEKQPGPC